MQSNRTALVEIVRHRTDLTELQIGEQVEDSILNNEWKSCECKCVRLIRLKRERIDQLWRMCTWDSIPAAHEDHRKFRSQSVAPYLLLRLLPLLAENRSAQESFQWQLSLFQMGSMDTSSRWRPHTNLPAWTSDRFSPSWADHPTKLFLVSSGVSKSPPARLKATHRRRDSQTKIHQSIALLRRERSRNHCIPSRDDMDDLGKISRWTGCLVHYTKSKTDAEEWNRRLEVVTRSFCLAHFLFFSDGFRGISFSILTVNWLTSVSKRW